MFEQLEGELEKKTSNSQRNESTEYYLFHNNEKFTSAFAKSVIY